MHVMLLAVLSTMLLVPGAVHAQSPAGPMPRDRPPVLVEGTAGLKGRVVDSVTGAAIPRARVRLSGPGGQRNAVLTDASGGFAFGKLPAGPYAVHAEKSGYLPGRYPTGATVRVRMKPIVLTDGQTLGDFTISMFRASAISGRVVDAHGDPVEFAQVQALRLVPGRAPTAHSSQATNDIGEFRLGRLQPGSYLVLAVASRTGPEEPPTAVGDAPSAQPLPTYYPGVLSMEQAQPVTLERGQSIANMELVLAEGIATIVTGRIVTAEGQPVTENAWVHARLANGPQRIDTGGSGIRRDGSFRFALAPGEYVLEAQATQTRRVQQPGPEHQLFGTLRLTVGTTHIDSLTIVVGHGAVATGRVVFEGTTPPPNPPANPIWLPLSSPDEHGGCRTRQARVNHDWTFRAEGLLGTCTAPPQSMFGRWTLKSVTVDGEDVLARPITFETGQQIRNVQVVFTDRRSSMTFRVVDERGQPTREYVALVFYTDKARWEKGPPVRTYVPPQFNPDLMSAAPRAPTATATLSPGRRARPETLEVLPPGEYYVVAVDDVEIEAMGSVELLERLVSSAMRVSVPEGTTVEVALRRVKLTDGR